MRRPAAALGRCAVIAVLVAAAPTAPAGDEVDYSAPYVTVEHGELVTKYPAKAHDDTKEGEEATPPENKESRVAPAVLAVVFTLGVVALVLLRAFARRTSRR